MKILSQRDPRWANVKLGTSNKTIESHGCTITCIAMMASLTPIEVNDRLLKVNGYANTNLVIWSKINEAIPWLDFVWRGKTYNNAHVLQGIKSNGAVLVEVDFDNKLKTNDKHWVLYVGNKKQYDPWVGSESPTNKYEHPTGYAIIKLVDEKPQEEETMGNELETCLTDRKKFWNERDELYKLMNVEDQKDALTTLRMLLNSHEQWMSHKCPEQPVIPTIDNPKKIYTGGKDFIRDKKGLLMEEKSYKTGK